MLLNFYKETTGDFTIGPLKTFVHSLVLWDTGSGLKLAASLAVHVCMIIKIHP